MRTAVFAIAGLSALLVIPNSAFAASPPVWTAIGTNGPGASADNAGVDDIVTFEGDLYAAGSFVAAGAGHDADYLARWDGQSWSKVGSGAGGTAVFNAPVITLAVLNGVLYAGGQFTDAGGDATADYIAKWNGQSWSGVGSNGAGDGAIPTSVPNSVLTIVPSGADLLVGGTFNNAAGDPAADNIARWSTANNGWSSIGSTNGDGALENSVISILPTASGLYAGGDFRNANNLPAADGLAYWNGTTWSALGADAHGDGWLNGSVFTIVKNGTDIDVGGTFLNVEGDESANYVARWDGSSWHPLGNVTDQTFDINARVSSLVMFNGKLTAGGLFSTASAQGVASWNGTDWVTVGPADAIYGINKLYVSSTTSLYAGGRFSNASGDPNADNIANLSMSSSKPDARIRKGNGPLIGNNVYSASAAGESLSASKAVGDSVQFKISVQNDGTSKGRFSVRAIGSGATGFAVKYFHSTTDITGAIQAGTFVTPSIAAGSSYLIIAKVTVTKSAAKGSSATRLVTVARQSVPPSDAVQFAVTRN